VVKFRKLCTSHFIVTRPGRTERVGSVMKGFAYGISGGLLAVFGTIAIAFGGLAVFAPSSLPAPALTTLIHLDEKLKFLRRHPEINPHLLVIGSSIAWRQLDGSALAPVAGGKNRVLNGGTANLQIHQAHNLLNFYLEHYHDVNTVLLMTELPDYDDCTKSSADMLNDDDGAAYAFHEWPTAYFYFRYFSPQRYANAAMSLPGRKEPFRGDLFLDDYGSGPVNVPDSMKRGLRYGQINPDPACIEAFGALSRSLAKRGIHFVVVFTPVNPDYLAAFPASSEVIGAIASKLANSTEQDGTAFVLMQEDEEFVPQDFYDAFHLQWPGVQRLSQRIAENIPALASKISLGNSLRLDKSDGS
jgi:hypothetical protein